MLLYNLLNNCKAESDSISVHFGSAMQLSKATEQLWKLFLGDSSPGVFNMKQQLLLDRVIAGLYFDRANGREFERIFDQVDQDLLHASFVSVKNRQLRFTLLVFLRRLWELVVFGKVWWDQKFLDSGRQFDSFRPSLRLEDDFGHLQDFVWVEPCQVE